MNAANKPRKTTRAKKSQILSLVDIFADLNPTQLDLIYMICMEKNFEKGQVIFEERSPSTEIYIVLDGQVDIVINAVPPQYAKSEPKPPVKIAIAQEGQSFGEIALVDEGLRSATAICGSDTCRLMVINRDDFMQLMREYQQLGFIVMYNLAVDLCTKLRQATYRVRP